MWPRYSQTLALESGGHAVLDSDGEKVVFRFESNAKSKAKATADA